MPIDYSKWDNLDVSSSSSSSEEDEEDYHPKKVMQQPAAATPRVTRLEAPSTVTFGGGASPVLRPPPPGPVATVSAAVAASAGGTSTTTAVAAGIRGNRNRNSSQRRHENKNETNEHDAPPTPKQQQPPLSWTERGGTASIGGAPLYWSQDRYSVTLRWELPGTTATTNHNKNDNNNNKNDTTAPTTTVVATVDIGGILPYRDRCAAVGTTLPTIAVRSKSGEVLLEERLPHPVHGAEEDGNRPEADWSVEPFAWSSGSAGSKQSKPNSKPNSNSSRNNHHHTTTTTTKKYLTIVLHKAVPMQGLSLWWRRPLLGVPEIDLADAKGDAVGASSKDFLGAWERAHELFREGKRTAKKPL